MRVEILSAVVAAKKAQDQGDIVELTEAEGKMLMAIGKARLAAKPKPAPATKPAPKSKKASKK